MYRNNGHERRIEVFRDTASQCRCNAHLKAAVKEAVATQQLILEGDEIPNLNSIDNQGCEAVTGSGCGKDANPIRNVDAEPGSNAETCPTSHAETGQFGSSNTEPRYDTDAEIIVSKKRSFEAAQAYACSSRKVCVLNFASATNSGGGVVHGSSAQEECLCRCSTLFPCIEERTVSGGFHYRHRDMLASGEMDSLYNDDCIFTPGVVVFKSDTALPQTLPESEWYSVDIITCAAPNLRENPGNYMNPGAASSQVKISDSELRMLHEKRKGRILDIAKANGAEVVILGAFGCGAFRNPPEVVAAGMFEAVKRHQRDFKTIEFVVYCSSRDTTNYEAFRRASLMCFGKRI